MSAERLKRGIPRGEVGGEAREAGLDRRDQGGSIGDEDGDRVRTVLGLGQQVERHELGIGIGVGHHQGLARSGRKVDGDIGGDGPLRGRDPCVAGADDSVDARNRCGPVGQRRDGLGAPDAQHPVDPDSSRGREDGR